MIHKHRIPLRHLIKLSSG